MAAIDYDRILRDYFQGASDVRLVYVFGSIARGRARAGSDLDVAVLYDRNRPPEDLLKRRLDDMAALSDRMDREVDLVALNEAGAVLTRQVLEHGRLVHEAGRGAARDFKARAMIEYIDWLPYKARLDAAVSRHFRRAAHG